MRYSHVSLIFILVISAIFLVLALGASQVGVTLVETLRKGPPGRRILAALAFLVPVAIVYFIAVVVIERPRFPHWLMH